MEVCIVPLQTVGLSKNKSNPSKRNHLAKLNAQVCKMRGAGNDTEKRFFSMLEKSIDKASDTGYKRQKLDHYLYTEILIIVGYDLETGSSVLLIGKKKDHNNTWFSRLERVCGGADKFTLDVDITVFSIKDNEFKVEVRGGQIGGADEYAGLHYRFSTPLNIIEKWEKASRLRAKLSVKLKLTDEALERIFLENMDNSPQGNKALLMDSSTSDAILVADNGEQVKCHKSILSDHSDVFKAMFESDLKKDNCTIQVPEMSEASVRALLANLYCWEIREISRSPSVTLELLVAADKYNIPKLQDTVRDLILLKNNEWFTPSFTVQLFHFVRNKGDLGEEKKYKSIKNKCIAVLKSIPKEDLHNCLDFQNLFADPQTGMDLFSYLLHALQIGL